MASVNDRKRKRLVDLSPTPSLEGDTSTITSRQTTPSAARSLQNSLASSLSHRTSLHSNRTIIASRHARSSASRSAVRTSLALSPTPSLHGDASTISSQHTSSDAAPRAQTSLALSRTRRSQTRQTYAPPHFHIGATTQTLPQMAEDTELVIPENCCYHCLNRGGNAAYECHREQGKERCERCIRDGNNKCRIPTAEESVTIAARCPQCTRRGFKKCDSGYPCDTCIRNKTEHLCHRPSEKKVKLERPAASRKSMAPPKSVDTSSQGRKSNPRPSRRMNTKTNNYSTMSRLIVNLAATSISEFDETVHNDTIAVVQPKTIAGQLTEDARRKQTAPAGRTAKRKLDSVLNRGLPSPLTSGDEMIDTTNPFDMQLSDEDTATEKDTKPQTTIGIGTRTRRSFPMVSYVEQTSNDDGSDMYTSPRTDEENNVDIEPISFEDDTSAISDNKSSVIMSLKNDLTVEEDCKQTGKGIDLSLKPLSTIEDCISDMTIKALKLGLPEALDHLKGRPIKVATMCSGTESPLLALDEICKALRAANNSPPLIQQEFSAEIEVFKQAFIERNFRPKILFRDVRDFIRESSTKATTAYGAEVEIPTDIDILIAGFVCRDLSRLNNKGKSFEDRGETGDTWLAVHTYAKRFRPSIVLLENVKSQNTVWDDVVCRWDEIDYEAAWLIRDTKNYYLPQTRERMYMVAIERSHFGEGVMQAVEKWQSLMLSLQRQCSSPYEAFLPDSLRESSTYSNPSSESNWALCKLRNDHIRSEKRLGILSPISRRSDNGTNMPPDFADRSFYNTQSSRVWDAIDIAHLEASQKGYDSLYKMALWDVSQNADRFKAQLGIAPCVTPNGRDFASNRQYALNGSQLLILQGMPLSRLLFANETERELQNLAGNAMSTTVIGASLISAIISGHKAFQATKTVDAQNSSSGTTESSLDDLSECSSLLSSTLLEPATYEQLDLDELNEEAKMSVRLCNCEGKQIMGKAAILTCSACGHSACSSCAGNPKHVYEKTVPSNHRTQPDKFIRRWRPRLPARLKVDFVDMLRLASHAQVDDSILSSYLGVISRTKISSQFFCLNKFSREHSLWKIEYSSPDATLELRLGRDTQWLMYVKCQSDLPGNNPLRDFLKNPIAHGFVSKTLLNVEWKVRLPCTKSYQLRMKGSTKRVSSWRSRLGLPDHKAETVPATMEIHSDVQGLAEITGVYEHLPHCGTACNSLYKRLGGEGNMYLFLDPDPIGRPDRDRFVFSQDHSRKSYGDNRMTVAQLDSSWRPWHMDAGHERLVDSSVSDLWIPATVELETIPISLDVRYLEGSRLNEHSLRDCSQLLPVLDVSVNEPPPKKALSGYSWALEKARILPSCSSWYEVRSNVAQECSCAPKYPNLIWSVNEKGVATAQEDRQAAAAFERALKMRPKILRLKESSDSTQTRIQISVDVVSLIHRAQGRLSGHSSVRTSWRLLTDHFDLPSQPFAKFCLKSNANDVPQNHRVATVPKYLFDEQVKSMVWMAKQELGTQMTISETEESVHSSLGWRVEARAETEVCVRGGVLADQPSFGKTVTSIALIQSEFDQYTPEVLIQRNELLAPKLPKRLESAATLVVCPPHIALQWRTELEKFLSKDQLQQYNVMVVHNFAKLKKLTIDDLLQSRVIIVAWNLFSKKEYISELADFTAMPEPTLDSRRAFDAWLTRAGNEIPSQLVAYQSHAYKVFQGLTQGLIESRLQHPDFTATIPIRIQHGRAYKSYGTTPPDAETTNASKPKGDSVTQRKSSTRTRLTPLLHLFRFNRVVIDEYHYLNDNEKVETSIKATAIKAIQSHKRWILSGTPALGGFSDVDQIASFLGIRFGRYVRGDGTFTAEKTTAKLDQTNVEYFLSQTESLSQQWHEARHERAQVFLDKFVRQNEAALQKIMCTEMLVPVELDAAHIAVYLELSQHLVPQRMQIKKLKKSSSDRNDRLKDSLENSSTAEEALLKSSLLHETAEEGKSGLELLTDKRSDELKSTRSDLRSLLVSFEHLMATEKNIRCGKQATGEASITELYARFKNKIAHDDYIGDEEANQSIRGLLAEAKRVNRAPNLSFPELKGKDERARLQIVKTRLSQLDELCDELTHRTRSKRFIATIQDHLRPATRTRSHSCSSRSCNGVTDIEELFLVSHCGHTACQSCLEARSDDESCVHPGCKARLGDGELIPMANLGSKESHAGGKRFGKKIDAIVELISRMPPTDQGILFAPNNESMRVLERVLDHHEIRYSSTRETGAAQVIEEFKTNKEPATMKKLLILDVGDESAAGINLVNANHVIFVSPLYTEKQYKYESSMAQAIARSRRHGQDKRVYIYHVVALRTIDVDILEQRHKRCEAMISAQSQSNRMWPSPCKKKEKTRLVRNRQGEMMLLPCSWLEDGQNRDLVDVDVSPERFTSPIKLSGAFDQEEDDE